MNAGNAVQNKLFFNVAASSVGGWQGMVGMAKKNGGCWMLNCTAAPWTPGPMRRISAGEGTANRRMSNKELRISKWTATAT